MLKLNRIDLTRCMTLALLLLTTPLTATRTHARELQGRLGLGYNAEFENARVDGGIPAISLKYGLNREFAIEGVFATTTGSPRNGVSAVKLFKNLFFETNLNFYTFLGGGIVAASGTSGAQFLGGFGAEFFIPGVESLGFSMETGGTLENLTSGSFALKTMGLSFLNAGMHFYF